MVARLAGGAGLTNAFSGEVDFRFATQVGLGRLGLYHVPISGKPEIGENASTRKPYAAARRRRGRVSSQIAITAFTRFQARPLTKAAR